MAWIRMIPDDEADDHLRGLYERYGNARGLDHIINIHSLDPESLKLHYDYYKHLMTARSGIGRTRREMIAVVSSAANECHY